MLKAYLWLFVGLLNAATAISDFTRNRVDLWTFITIAAVFISFGLAWSYRKDHLKEKAMLAQHINFFINTGHEPTPEETARHAQYIREHLDLQQGSGR